ncbi:MAG: 1-acyl-sn-glycerol-3-phosphate acyltransferase [Bacteroidales bacterium]
MLRLLAIIAFYIFGWKTDGTLPPDLKKGIIIFAPHTSKWDFVIGRLTLLIARIPLRVLIKKESFVFPWRTLLKSLGAIPVDRGKKNFMVDHLVQLFNESPLLFVVITPEGTRKLVKQWKKGFYLIAMEANVPIILSYIDYGKKTGGIGPVFYPGGDYAKDMEFIYKFYGTKQARHPGLFYMPQNFTSNEI